MPIPVSEWNVIVVTGEVNFVRDFDCCTIVHCRTAADLFKTNFPTCANLQEQWQNTVAHEKHAVNTSPAIGVIYGLLCVETRCGFLYRV